jgi:ketosteroid isomerase-like protein
MSEANLAVAREAFECFQRGDVDALLDLTAGDQLVTFSPETVPNGGTFHGREGYLEWASAWLEAWERFSIELLEIAPLDDRWVFSAVHQSAVGKGSGVPVELDTYFLVQVVDGTIQRIELYLDRAQARAVPARATDP